MLEKLQKWDVDLFLYLNNLGLESLDGFWLLLTETTAWLPLFLLIFILIYKSYGRKQAAWILLFLLTGLGVSIVLMLSTKYFFGRLRPSSVPEFAELIRALKKPTGYSFYSGHASSSFYIATFSVLVLKKCYKWVYVFFLFPVLFTLSRIFIGVHYPSDLLAGAFMGTVIAFIFYVQWRKNAVQNDH